MYIYICVCVCFCADTNFFHVSCEAKGGGGRLKGGTAPTTRKARTMRITRLSWRPEAIFEASSQLFPDTSSCDKRIVWKIPWSCAALDTPSSGRAVACKLLA